MHSMEMEEGEVAECVRGGGSGNGGEHDSFEDMGLHPDLLRGVFAMGFERPSVVQKKTIPIGSIGMGGRDLVAQAQSGTGKTGAFGIGLLQSQSQFHKKNAGVHGIVLTPTRELATQTVRFVEALGHFFTPRVKCVEATGKWRLWENKRALDEGGTSIVVGTPARILRLLRDGNFDGRTVGRIILDEADELLEEDGRGRAGDTTCFLEEVRAIMTFCHEKCAVSLFSATLPARIDDVVRGLLRDPVRITVKASELTLDGIKQFYVPLGQMEGYGERLAVLCDLFGAISVNQTVVFANRRSTVEKIAVDLRKSGHGVASLHGEMDTGSRTRAMDDFRRGSARVLVATNLVARGIDVQQVSGVVLFDAPDMRSAGAIDMYIHQVGRSGRFGRTGAALILAGDNDKKALERIETHYDTQVLPCPEDIERYFR